MFILCLGPNNNNNNNKKKKKKKKKKHVDLVEFFIVI